MPADPFGMLSGTEAHKCEPTATTNPDEEKKYADERFHHQSMNGRRELPRRTGRASPSTMKTRIRELLHATPFAPFVIRMADGREYRIEHPDFVLAASSDTPQIVLEEVDGSVHFLSVLLMTSVMAVSPHSQAA